jgi:hypothetical protein
MATKKNGEGTSLTSLFENIEEKGFGDVGAEDLKTPRISIVQAMSPQRRRHLLFRQQHLYKWRRRLAFLTCLLQQDSC